MAPSYLLSPSSPSRRGGLGPLFTITRTPSSVTLFGPPATLWQKSGPTSWRPDELVAAVLVPMMFSCAGAACGMPIWVPNALLATARGNPSLSRQSRMSVSPVCMSTCAVSFLIVLNCTTEWSKLAFQMYLPLLKLVWNLLFAILLLMATFRYPGWTGRMGGKEEAHCCWRQNLLLQVSRTSWILLSLNALGISPTRVKDQYCSLCGAAPLSW